MRKLVLFPSLIAAVILPGALPAKDLGYYDWVAVAPIVVSGVSTGWNGKYAELAVESVFRGDVAQGQTLRIHLKRANRNRNLETQRYGLKLVEGQSYIVLLESIPAKRRDGEIFGLVRGIRGARDVPSEGSPAIFDAIRRFVDIQARKDDRYVWRAFAEMLEDPNPLLIGTALDQFIKFRRADPEHMPAIRPLLDHPAPDLRERAAQLTGQVVGEVRDEQPEVQNELVALARRDPVIAVRVAATRALAPIDGEAVCHILRTIADEDPHQLVRYTAETLLFDRRQRDLRRSAAAEPTGQDPGRPEPN